MLKNKLNLKKYLILNVLVFIIFFSCEQENKVEDPTIGETSISINNNTLNDIYGSELDKLKNIAITRNFRLPVSVAEQIAIETATKMRVFEGVLTKSDLSISSIHKIKGNEKELVLDTKAEDIKNNDSVSDMYLMNFENNQGYVLMSGDERASGILSYSSEGQLKDTLDNAGQFILLEKSTSLIEEKRKEFAQMETQLIVAAEEDIFKTLSKEKQDSLISKGFFDNNGKRIFNKASSNCAGIPKYKEVDYCSEFYVYCRQYNSYTRVGQLRRVETIGPLVRTLWNQWPDYNNNINAFCNNRLQAPVGCVSVAVGQILAYHRKPNVINNQQIHWNEITALNGSFSTYNNIFNSSNRRFAFEIPYLLATLGSKDYLKMNYDTKKCSSGAYSQDALSTLKKLGYKDASKINYDNNLVLNEIRNNRPVYIAACGTNSTCHAWILDGYVRILQDITTITMNTCSKTQSEYTYNNTTELVHNNFGWGEGNSGWYAKGLFNNNIGIPYGSGEFINNSFTVNPTNVNLYDNSNSDFNFKFNNEIIINIK